MKLPSLSANENYRLLQTVFRPLPGNSYGLLSASEKLIYFVLVYSEDEERLDCTTRILNILNNFIEANPPLQLDHAKIKGLNANPKKFFADMKDVAFSRLFTNEPMAFEEGEQYIHLLRKIKKAADNSEGGPVPSSMTRIKEVLEKFAVNNPPLKFDEVLFDRYQSYPSVFFTSLTLGMLLALFLDVPKGFQMDLVEDLLFHIRGEMGTLPVSEFAPSEAVITSFGCEYKDPLNAVHSFAKFLMECSDAFLMKPNVFLSPCVSVIQSSMYGKTRLIREIARSHYRTVYVCLRDERSSGYPFRTKDAYEYLFVQRERDTDFSRVLADRFKRLICSALENLPDPRDPVDPVANPKKESIEFPSDLIGNKFWNAQLLKPCDKSDTIIFPKGELLESQMVVLAIDEARHTLENSYAKGGTLFQYIRKAAKLCALELPSHIRFIVVSLDTSHRIQNFSPPLLFHSSHRPTEFEDERRQLELFRPHILSHTYDVHFTRVLPPGTTDLRPLIESKEWLNAGRPTMKALSSPGDFTLETKLQSGALAPTKTVDRLAIVLARVGAQVHRSHHFASEMVAGNMATLLDMDRTGESCITTFVSEPALARAAGRIWWRDCMLETTLIPALHEGVASGGVNKGRDGELVAQVIILLAFDKVCKALKKDLGELVPLRLMITELLPDELNEVAVDDVLDRCIPAALRGAQVSCVQFVNLCGQLERDEILRMAERHCGWGTV